MKIDAYVSDRQKNRRKRRLIFFSAASIFILYLVFFGIAWFIGRSPLFRLDTIAVKGNDSVSKGDVVSLLQASALRDHSFTKAVLGFGNLLMWPSSVPAADLALIPQLASVTTAKDYFANTLNVTVTERDHFGIWCFEVGRERCYWFDHQGVLFEKALNAEGNLIFTVHDNSQRARGLNQKILPDSFLPNLISIITVLHKTGLAVSGIELKDVSLEEVTARTENGPSLYFSLRFPATNDLPVIEGLMTRSGFSKLQYIDCRTENRIYYK